MCSLLVAGPLPAPSAAAAVPARAHGGQPPARRGTLGSLAAPVRGVRSATWPHARPQLRADPARFGPRRTGSKAVGEWSCQSAAPLPPDQTPPPRGTLTVPPRGATASAPVLLQLAKSAVLLALPAVLFLLAPTTVHAAEGAATGASVCQMVWSQIVALPRRLHECLGMASAWPWQADLVACALLCYALSKVPQATEALLMRAAEAARGSLQRWRSETRDPGFGMEWRWYTLQAAAKPLRNVLQAGIAVAAVLTAIHLVDAEAAITVPLPTALRWLDPNQDGFLSSAEIQVMAVKCAGNVLAIVGGLNLYAFVMDAKAPPKAPKAGGRAREDCSSSFPVDRHFFNLLRVGDKGLAWETRALAHLVDRGLGLAAFLAVAVPVTSAAGVGLSSVLAFGGISGLALGFASQTMVANAIAGLIIVVNRPFMEGDEIILSDKHEGRVVEIGWHSTTLISKKDGLVRVVPNKQLSGTLIVNKSRRQYHRIQAHFDVTLRSYARLEALVQSLTDALRTHPELLKLPGYVNDSTGCTFEGTPDSGGMRLIITAYVKPQLGSAHVTELKSRVLQQVVSGILAGGGQLMLPGDFSPTDIEGENTLAAEGHANGSSQLAEKA